MRKRLLLTGFITGFACLYLLLWVSSANINAQGLKLSEKQLKGFKYSIYATEADQALIQVDYDTHSEAGLLNYKNEVVSLSRQYASSNPTKRFTVDITLKQPIPPDQLQSYSEQQGLVPEDFVIRTVTAGGQPGTISGAIGNNRSIAQEDLNRLLQGIQQSGEKVSVLGVVCFHATIVGSDYERISSDSAIYLVDAVQPFLTEETIKVRSNLKASNIKYNSLNPYWYLEELGLLKGK